MGINDDIRSPEALGDPHGFFHRLRAADPVHWSRASAAWIITSYAEVCAAFADARLSSDRLTPLVHKMSPEHRRAMAQTVELLRGWMVFRDPPAHGTLRDPVRRAFTPRATGALADKIAAIVGELIDEMAAADGEERELISTFAFPLPAIVIAELLGVPPEDREKFKASSRKLSGLVFGAVEQPNRDEAAAQASAEFTEYFSWLIRRREASPGDDLISALIHARDEGNPLTGEHIIGACTMLLFAGHETTTTLIGNGVATLLQHPEQLDRLRRAPALTALAVEECLRFEGPTKVMVRHATVAHERGGHEVRAGDRLYLSVAGANRDPQVFDNPDRFDVAREPNPHLGFGHGTHFCLGAPLARMEAQIALTALLRRFPRMSLAAESLQWVSGIVGRGVSAVPIRLGSQDGPPPRR